MDRRRKPLVGKAGHSKMNNSLRVSSTVSLCGIISGLAFTVTPALAEEPAERAEVASVEESTPQLQSEDATAQPTTYSAEPDSGSNAAAQSPTSIREPRLGGHVGVATPFVTLSSETTTIADQFTLLHPIGISVKFDKITVDF